MSKTYQVRVATLNSADALALQQAGWEPFAAASMPAHSEHWSGGGSYTSAYWEIVFRKATEETAQGERQ